MLLVTSPTFSPSSFTTGTLRFNVEPKPVVLARLVITKGFGTRVDGMN